MAVFRQIQTTYWQDGFVLTLTPEEKYFYIYLMTNSKTTQCGIYELPYRVIEMETGYNRETVEKLLDRFVKYKKVMYNESTQEIMLINWIKHNLPKGDKMIKCIEKELKTIKDAGFKELLYTLCNRYGYPIDTPSIPLGEEEEKEEEQQQEEEQEKPNAKKTYLDYVTLTDREFENLNTKLGKEVFEDLLFEINVWLANNPKKRKDTNCNLTIQNWYRRRMKEQQPNPSLSKDKPNIPTVEKNKDWDAFQREIEESFG